MPEKHSSFVVRSVSFEESGVALAPASSCLASKTETGRSGSGPLETRRPTSQKISGFPVGIHETSWDHRKIILRHMLPKLQKANLKSYDHIQNKTPVPQRMVLIS
jgi:hypothetical protein